MGLSMRERHAVTRELAPRFQRAGRKERSRILSHFVALTGYSRCYGAYLLRKAGKKELRTINGRRIVFIPAQARPPGAKRKRARRYGNPALLAGLRRLWALSDGLCGKRLVAFIRESVPHLERQGALKVANPIVHQQLLKISPATVDRLLQPTRRQAQLKGRSYTRPGTLLKYHIPIKTFADWDNTIPGFCEVDLVAHEGGSAFGDFCQTLTLTDVATAWTEAVAVKNKAQVHVFAALEQVRSQLPFPLLGLDSDNGSEFINHELLRYCHDHRISFTRSRAYKKNDNCYVEQKNYSIVRKTVGYYRYDNPHQLELLNCLYLTLRLYTNFFQPVMKLKEKLRTGSQLRRRYDTPRTPFRRLLDHPQAPELPRSRLLQQYETLDLLALKRELNRLQKQLFDSAVLAGPPPRPPLPCYPGPDHPWRQAERRDFSRSKNLDFLHKKYNTPNQQ